MSHYVTRIEKEYVIPAWHRVKEHLKPAIKRSKGRWEPEYVLAALVTGRHNLWVVTEGTGNEVVGAITTEVIYYPEKRMLMIHFLGGKGMDKWYVDMSDAMSEHARESGCTGIECIARSGFWKWFQNDGFEKTAVFYEKSI
jgi:hypothetical protein